MKKYYISHNKEDYLKLWEKVETKGQRVDVGWNGDYLVGTFEYKGKIYELWNNMELGIASEIDEMEVSEYEQRNK